jgi:hypothetical protein
MRLIHDAQDPARGVHAQEPEPEGQQDDGTRDHLTIGRGDDKPRALMHPPTEQEGSKHIEILGAGADQT